jgi:hypothetical protein
MAVDSGHSHRIGWKGAGVLGCRRDRRGRTRGDRRLAPLMNARGLMELIMLNIGLAAGSHHADAVHRDGGR